jgi:hypothetical protein
MDDLNWPKTIGVICFIFSFITLMPVLYETIELVNGSRGASLLVLAVVAALVGKIFIIIGDEY